jgi:hemolysin activation/secretion protein
MIFLMVPFTAFAAVDRDAPPRFDITSYRVEGSTIFTAGKLAAILAPYTGSGRDFGTVQEALEALEKAYHQSGFTTVIVSVPEQEVKKGVVTLRVIERHIRKITIEGNQFFNRDNILRSLPSLRSGEIPNINTISQSLKVANDSPAKTTRLSLSNSGTNREVDAILAVKDEKPWKAGIAFDNSGTKETGISRMGFLLQHANIADRDHLLMLQYITSPENLEDVSVYSVGYRIPFYATGSSLDIIGAYSNVSSGKIDVSSYTMDVSGKGTMLGLRYNQNLVRIAAYEHKLVLGLDYRAYDNDVDLSGFQLGGKVTVHPVSLTYAGILTENTLTVGMYFTAVQNLPGSWDGRDEEENFENARTGASDTYHFFRYGANAQYSAFGDWQIRAKVNGQYTKNTLVPGEQFGLGGASSVRGFNERQFSDDRGYSGNLEVYTPDLCPPLHIPYVHARLLVFYDYGYIRRNDPLPGEQHSLGIASLGPGLRITDGKRFSLSADYGFVVDAPDDRTSRWSGMWHLAASMVF